MSKKYEPSCEGDGYDVPKNSVRPNFQQTGRTPKGMSGEEWMEIMEKRAYLLGTKCHTCPIRAGNFRGLWDVRGIDVCDPQIIVGRERIKVTMKLRKPKLGETVYYK